MPASRESRWTESRMRPARRLCFPSCFPRVMVKPLLGVFFVGLGLWGLYGSTKNATPLETPITPRHPLATLSQDQSETPCDQLASVQRNMDDEGGQCNPLPSGEAHVGWLFVGQRDPSPHAITTLAWYFDDKCVRAQADSEKFTDTPMVTAWHCAGGRAPVELWTLREGVPGPITVRDRSGSTWCLTAMGAERGDQRAEIRISPCQQGAKNQIWVYKDNYLSIILFDGESPMYVTARNDPQIAIASKIAKEEATKLTFIPVQKCNWPSRWIMRPSACRVKGQLIEELDPLFNYRRGVEIGYMNYGEDKTHLLPWLLASKQDLTQSRRKVLFDFGGATFDTSTQWFLQMYPLDFDEIYVFEVIKNLYVKPHSAEEHPIHVFRKSQLDKIQLFEGTYVSTKDSSNSINITRWMLEDLKLSPEDAVIVKMDIESEEWNILPLWIKEHKIMATIVDELFVEVHFGHPSMIRWDWDKQFPSKGRRDALQLIMDLRAAGIYTHIWP